MTKLKKAQLQTKLSTKKVFKQMRKAPCPVVKAQMRGVVLDRFSKGMY